MLDPLPHDRDRVAPDLPTLPPGQPAVCSRIESMPPPPVVGRSAYPLPALNSDKPTPSQAMMGAHAPPSWLVPPDAAVPDHHRVVFPVGTLQGTRVDLRWHGSHYQDIRLDGAVVRVYGPGLVVLEELMTAGGAPLWPQQPVAALSSGSWVFRTPSTVRVHDRVEGRLVWGGAPTGDIPPTTVEIDLIGRPVADMAFGAMPGTPYGAAAAPPPTTWEEVAERDVSTPVEGATAYSLLALTPEEHLALARRLGGDELTDEDRDRLQAIRRQLGRRNPKAFSDWGESMLNALARRRRPT